MKNKQNLQLPKIKYSLTIIKFAEYLAVIYSAPHFLNFSRNKVPGVVTIIPTPSTPAFGATNTIIGLLPHAFSKVHILLTMQPSVQNFT